MAFSAPVNRLNTLASIKSGTQISDNVLNNTKVFAKAKSNNGFKFVDLEDQFKAACDAIQNLPKNGQILTRGFLLTVI